MDTRGGENRKPEYLAVNPMGKIPALVDGSVRLWESNAINWFVAERHPEAALLPATIEGRASVQRWLFFQAAHVSQACVPLFLATNRRAQQFWQTKGDERAADAARKDLARWLPVLEGALAGREWLLAPHPAVRAWLERLLARPAWRRAATLVFGE
jgi:glutathione S-transferase